MKTLLYLLVICYLTHSAGTLGLTNPPSPDIDYAFTNLPALGGLVRAGLAATQQQLAAAPGGLGTKRGRPVVLVGDGTQ